MKNRIISIICCAVAALALTACHKEDPEAYPGEKHIQNTAWGVFDESGLKTTMYVVCYSVDKGCDVYLPGDDQQMHHFLGAYIFNPADHSLKITPASSSEDYEHLPTEIFGNVDAEGLHLYWSHYRQGDIDRLICSGLFTYICKADELN